MSASCHHHVTSMSPPGHHHVTTISAYISLVDLIFYMVGKPSEKFEEFFALNIRSIEEKFLINTFNKTIDCMSTPCHH